MSQCLSLKYLESCYWCEVYECIDGQCPVVLVQGVYSLCLGFEISYLLEDL